MRIRIFFADFRAFARGYSVRERANFVVKQAYGPGLPDGSNPAEYRWLAALDRPGWAWEWLRRDSGYVGRSSLPPDAQAGPSILQEAPDPARGLLFRRAPRTPGVARAHLLRCRD